MTGKNLVKLSTSNQKSLNKLKTFSIHVIDYPAITNINCASFYLSAACKNEV